MKKIATQIGMLFLLLIFTACPKPAPPPVKFELNRPFGLKVGQSADCADVLGFSIRFEQVSADSRCPQGVECITAGKADVVLVLTKSSGTQTITLPFTLPNGTSNVTDFNGHTIRIMGLAPFKIKDREILPEDYVVSLLVIDTPTLPKANPGEDFSIKVGERFLLANDNKFQIRLDSISADSRCPENVQCIWAGKVDAAFTLIEGDSRSQVILSNGDLGQGGKTETPFGPYTLTFKSVDPPKKQGLPIPQNAYSVTLVYNASSNRK